MSEIALFEQKEIRRTWQNEKWYFSVVDVCGALSNTENPKRYWSDLKRKLAAEGASEAYEKIVRLKRRRRTWSIKFELVNNP